MHLTGGRTADKKLPPAALPFGHSQSQHAGPPHCLDPSPLLTKTQTVCFSLTGHKYHHCCPPPPLNGSSILFATIYDLFQGPVTGAKEGGGPGKGLQRPPPPPRKPIFPHPSVIIGAVPALCENAPAASSKEQNQMMPTYTAPFGVQMWCCGWVWTGILPNHAQMGHNDVSLFCRDHSSTCMIRDPLSQPSHGCSSC